MFDAHDVRRDAKLMSGKARILSDPTVDSGVTAGAGSRRSRPFHTRGSAARRGPASWHVRPHDGRQAVLPCDDRAMGQETPTSGTRPLIATNRGAQLGSV